MILSYYDIDEIKDAVDNKMLEMARFVSARKRSGTNHNVIEYLERIIDMEEGLSLIDEDYTTTEQKTIIASYLLNLGKINL